MTPQDHPITPPPELVQQWLGTYFSTTITGEVSDLELTLAAQAARWGADQELEACINYFLEYDSSWGENSELITGLRAARRPKPLSLKDQSLALIDKIQSNKEMWQTDDLDVVRRALESLPD
jgi:hypothetical protein